MRPYVVLSVAMSMDGYIDDTSARRLLLSDEADLDRVDGLRASCDAILVGAGTVRADDPRLRVRSPERRRERIARGLPATPMRVVLGGRGELSASARVFAAAPGARPLLILRGEALQSARQRFSGVADVVQTGPNGDPGEVLTELASRGVRRLLLEGGTTVNTAFLASCCVDEMQVAVAPVLVGESGAPRLAADAEYPWRADRARLLDVSAVGDMAVVRWGLSERASAT